MSVIKTNHLMLPREALVSLLHDVVILNVRGSGTHSNDWY
jgi:hypothetical protein